MEPLEPFRFTGLPDRLRELAADAERDRERDLLAGDSLEIDRRGSDSLLERETRALFLLDASRDTERSLETLDGERLRESERRLADLSERSRERLREFSRELTLLSDLRETEREWERRRHERLRSRELDRLYLRRLSLHNKEQNANRCFSNVNDRLEKQLFKHLPSITATYRSTTRG